MIGPEGPGVSEAMVIEGIVGVDRNNQPVSGTFEIRPRNDLACPGCHACCQAGTQLELGPVEADFMIESGNEIEEVAPEKGSVPTAVGTNLYVLLSECVHLEGIPGDVRFCSIFESPDRPRACNRLRTGSPACQIIRHERGVDVELRAHRVQERPDDA